jgi:hypothetical protein
VAWDLARDSLGALPGVQATSQEKLRQAPGALQHLVSPNPCGLSLNHAHGAFPPRFEITLELTRVQDSGVWIIDDEQRVLSLRILGEISRDAFRRFARSRSTSDVLGLDE